MMQRHRVNVRSISIFDSMVFVYGSVCLSRDNKQHIPMAEIESMFSADLFDQVDVNKRGENHALISGCTCIITAATNLMSPKK